MRKRTGGWQDILGAYSLALDGKKMVVGYLGVLFTVFVLVVASIAYAGMAQWGYIGSPSEALVAVEKSGGHEHVSLMLDHIVMGESSPASEGALVLLNPFRGGLAHFILSLAVYTVLLLIWSFVGGVISRLAALEYATDDLPTLADADKMVRARRWAFFMAPMTPLIGILLFSVANMLGGLVVSIPYLGRVLLVPGYLLLLISGILMTFLIVGGVLGFYLMMPAMSMGGKGAFDGWSTAYTYVLWGFPRYLLYTLIAAVVGVLSTWAVMLLTALLLYCIEQTVAMGFVGAIPWLPVGGEGFAPAGFHGLFQMIMLGLRLLVCAIPLAYLASYVFAAGTIVFALLRKHVDNVEIEDVYEPEPAEEDPGEEAAAEQPEEEIAEEIEPEQAEEAPAEATPEQEQEAAEEEGAGGKPAEAPAEPETGPEQAEEAPPAEAAAEPEEQPDDSPEQQPEQGPEDEESAGE